MTLRLAALGQFPLQVALVMAVACVVVGVGGACPGECRCSLDGRGRRAVVCEGGGMSDPVPVAAMGADTEVLVITAPALRRNNLTLGPIFKGLRRLEEIHVTGSNVPALGAHSLWGLTHLQVLNLTDNHIAALIDTNFRGADSLRDLDLSRNRIESVPSAVFRYVRHLRSLTLAHNMMPELVPRIFFGLTRLRYLDLSYNPLQDLHPEQFADVPELQRLLCAGCGLTSLSTTLLQALSQLQELDLHNNRLTQVPPGVTTFLPKLTVLQLDGNLVSFVERGVVGGAALRQLHLAYNRINRVEVGAFANASLESLDLSYNRLTHLDTTAISQALTHLHELHLSGNSLHIEQLLLVLPQADQLRHLSLGDMGLTRLPDDLLQNLGHLYHLNLSANYLAVFPAGVLDNAPNLRSLDLSANTMQALEQDSIASIGRARYLRKLRLERNPWRCDQCHVEPLLRWLQDAPDQESGCAEPRVWTCLRCAGPPSVAGLELAMLPLGDVPQCPKEARQSAPWPTWDTPPVATQRSQKPRRQPTQQEPLPPTSFTHLLKERFHLVIVGGCCLVLFLLIVVVVGVVLRSRQTAFYYTCEQNKARSSTNNNSRKTSLTAPRPDVTIATIDELTDINGSQEGMKDHVVPIL